MTLKVRMNFPTRMRLKLDGDKVLEKAGKVLSDAVKERLDGGQGASGALPEPKSGGEPLKDTGKLIASIKYQKAKQGQYGFVFPSGKRDGRRNAMIMAVQIATRKLVDDSDPMGVTDENEVAAGEAAEAEIARQLAEPDKGLLAERKELLKILK